MKTLKKILIRTLIVLIILIVAVGAFFTFVPFSEGMRAGQVIKLSKKGILFKTWEGELNTMMMPANNNMGTITPNVWQFSVANKEVAEQMMKASANGERMELHYKEKYYKFPWQGDTKYFVYKMESVAPAANPAIQTPQQIQTNVPIGGVNSGKVIEVK